MYYQWRGTGVEQQTCKRLSAATREDFYMFFHSLCLASYRKDARLLIMLLFRSSGCYLSWIDALNQEREKDWDITASGVQTRDPCKWKKIGLAEFSWFLGSNRCFALCLFIGLQTLWQIVTKFSSLLGYTVVLWRLKPTRHSISRSLTDSYYAPLNYSASFRNIPTHSTPVTKLPLDLEF